MRNLIITLLLSVISIMGFAQTPFTEETLDGITKLMLADINKSNENLSPNFLFINAEGVVVNAEQLKATLKTHKISEWQLSDVKIKQVGEIAHVTGINKHIINTLDGKQNYPYNVRFAYTYEYVKGVWQWSFAQHTHIQQNATNADNPIEIYKQWVAEYNKDTKAFLIDKCPDDLRGTVNGGAFYGNSGFKTMPEGQKAYLEPSDMKSFQSGNLAVVMGIFTRPKKQADGTEKMGKEVFTAVMQKRNGKWLYVGHHATDMKE